MTMRRQRNHGFDPIADWDGRISAWSPLYGHKLITSKDRHRISVENMKQMEKLDRIEKEDAVERCPPRRQAKTEWWR